MHINALLLFQTNGEKYDPLYKKTYIWKCNIFTRIVSIKNEKKVPHCRVNSKIQ